MHLTLTCDNETTDLELSDGAITLGGGAHDSIRMTGLPYGLVKVTVRQSEVEVLSSRPLRIGTSLFPARMARLLLPGEVLRLPNDVELARPVTESELEKRRTTSTALVTRELLSMADAPAQVTSKAASFTCVAGPDKGSEFILAFAVSRIGRAREADIRLHDMAVSRAHALVKRTEAEFSIEEAGKTNGVFVNGRKVVGTQPLNGGDVIEVGQSVLRFDAGVRDLQQAPVEKPVFVEPQRTREPIDDTGEVDSKVQIADQRAEGTRSHARLTALTLVTVLAAVMSVAGIAVALTLLLR